MSLATASKLADALLTVSPFRRGAWHTPVVTEYLPDE